jgi:hypothetical protein
MTHFVIQEGEILNEKFGFEDAFYWRLIDDKPFYFFLKGPGLGISYDGQFLPFYYDSIPREDGWRSNPASPRAGENGMGFFGRRDGLWYYVEFVVE